MTNEIYLFKTKLTPERNALIDELDDYLDTCDSMSATVVYQKIDLDFAVKLEMSQDYLPNIGYNYAKIIQDNQSYYFFILDATWTSSKCVTLSLSIDSINTFNGRLIWNDKTHITRQHKDRFVKKEGMVSGSTYNLVRKIDKTSEGIQPVKLRDSFATIYDDRLNDASKWYLIYRSEKDPSTESQANPIQCFLTSNFDYYVRYSYIAEIPFPSTSKPIVISVEDLISSNATITLSNATSSTNVSLQKHFTSTNTFAVVLYVLNGAYRYAIINTQPSSSGIYISTVVEGTYTTLTSSGSFGFRYSTVSYTTEPDRWMRLLTNVEDTVTYIQRTDQPKINNINSVDRTDTRLIKIIELPYPPVRFTVETITTPSLKKTLNVPEGWSYNPGEKMFQLNNLGIRFENYFKEFSIPNTVAITKTTDMYHKDNNINYETKLKHSDFYNGKFVYDSNSKDINFEDIPSNGDLNNITARLTFLPTTTINSKFLFKVDTVPVMTEYGDYDQFIAVDRNNEIALYNDEYINYVKTGINYDRKAQGAQIATSVLGTIGTAAAAVGSIIAAAPTGGISLVAGISLASGAVASLTNTVNTIASSERNIRQKLEQASLQATAISGANDIDLLNEYCGNKMQYFTYGILDKTKKAVYNMLRLTGYTDDVYDVPDFNSRIWYNFVQCTPDFDNEDVIAKKFVDDYKARFAAGVTVYHRNGGEIDFEQEYENFETWIAE